MKQSKYKTNEIIISTSNFNLFDFIDFIRKKFSDINNYICFENMNNLETAYNQLELVEKGGFSHGEVATQYGKKQLDARYFLSRKVGYLGLSGLLQREKKWSSDDIVLDVLAGNGTFSRVIKSLFKTPPKYIGNDVSFTMAMEGINNNELIIYGDIRNSILKNKIADYGICAYGSHHIPHHSRQSFFNACYNKMKFGSTFVLQDFEEGDITAKWYKEVINTYRSCGHKYIHFTILELENLLSKAGFDDINACHIYDPFILKADFNETDIDLQLRFYDYLVTLFSLDKLNIFLSLPAKERLNRYNKFLLPYFNMNNKILEKSIIDKTIPNKNHIKTDHLTISKIKGDSYLIAPRIAIAAVGIKKSSY